MLHDISLWKQQPHLDPVLRAELDGLSESQLQEVFTHNIAFGTGGMRGVMGVGTDRINRYTIRKATIGLARYFLAVDPKAQEKGVAIAYDTRLNSAEFASEAARVLLSFGIRVYLFESFRSTPQLSFAVRHFSAVGGIMLTASHNPPQYNGYKIYNSQGCQFVPAEADQVIALIDQVDNFFTINLPTLQQNPLLTLIPASFDDIYLNSVKKVVVQPVEAQQLKVVFTPLHGVASVYGPRLLTELGYHVTTVPEQMINDPYFKAVKSPNPEEKGAFELAIPLGHRVGAHLLLATDPDADRMGIAVLHDGQYRLFNGNETGTIMMHYLAQFKKTVKPGVVFSTIVSSDLPIRIAKDNGLETALTLTGFKFIGEQIELSNHQGKQFVFGYEESYGYLANDDVRDKDAFQALALISEIAAYYLAQGKTLVDVLREIYEKYGFYQETLINVHLLGLDGMDRMNRIMKATRHAIPTSFAGLTITAVADYMAQTHRENGKVTAIEYPPSDVMKFFFQEGGWMVFRPSGTEPKLKIYISLRGNTSTEVDQRIAQIRQTASQWVEGIK